MTASVVQVVRGRTIRVARGAARKISGGIAAARLRPVRVGARVGSVFAFHGVLERVDDRDLQRNHVDIDAFTRALDAIAERFDIVGLDELLARFEQGGSPSPVAALTFDDGYRSTLELAHPILASRGIPYSIFVCPGLIDAGSWPPTFVVQAAIRFARAEDLRLPVVGVLRLETGEQRRVAALDVVEMVKRLPQPQVREVVAACRELLGGDMWAAVEERFASERLLTWEEVRTLAGAGVAVGSHTSEHAGLHAAQTPGELSRQLVGSRLRLEEALGFTCRLFCYPYGRYADLSPAAVRAVEAAGYEVGLTLETASVRIGMSRMVLPRIYVGPKFDPRGLDRLLATTRDRMFVRETARRGLTGSGSRRIARAPDAPVS